MYVVGFFPHFFLLLHYFYLCPIFFFQEEKLPGILVQHGVWSRFSSTLGTEVDRLLFHGTHAQMIQKLMGITLP